MGTTTGTFTFTDDAPTYPPPHNTNKRKLVQPPDRWGRPGCHVAWRLVRSAPPPWAPLGVGCGLWVVGCGLGLLANSTASRPRQLDYTPGPGSCPRQLRMMLAAELQPLLGVDAGSSLRCAAGSDRGLACT